MKLKAEIYHSPIPTYGTFAEVFIEDSKVTVEKFKKYMSITFDMYYMKDGERVVIDERSIAFSENKETAVISIPNPVTEPHDEQAINPDYNSEDPESLEFTTVTIIPPATIQVPLLKYLAENNGELPENYEVANYGYPSFDIAQTFFSGGERNNLDIEIPNSFAKDWLLHTLIMQNERIGIQFNFINE